MPSDREVLLRRYRYDPLDRLVYCALPITEQPSIQRFYRRDRLATEIQGVVQCSIMQHDDHQLAQQNRQAGTIATWLLATDLQRSVLCLLDVHQPNPFAYSAYGHRPPENGLLSLLGFNGECLDTVTGCYLLGSGYRAFNPVLMRFNSPDSWSPFGYGGLNAYAYCEGDPVNFLDPTGHAGITGMLKFIGRKLGFRKSPPPVHGSISSGYASIKSYSDVANTTPPLPLLPLRAPPGGTTQNTVSTLGPSASVRPRNPTGRRVLADPVLSKLPVQKPDVNTASWLDSVDNVPDEQLSRSNQIPRAGAVLHKKEHLAVQARGVSIESERLKSFFGDYQQVGYINKKGEISVKWERLKIRRT